MVLREPDGIAFNDGMLEELRVVVGGEIGPVVSASALITRQGGTGHEQAKSVDILGFMRTSSLRMGHTGSNSVQVFEEALSPVAFLTIPTSRHIRS